MTAVAETLPRWDMTVVYPGLDSPEFAAGFAAMADRVAGLTTLFDRHGVEDRPPAALDDATVAAFDEVVARYNAVLEEMETLRFYVASFVETDSRDATAQARLSELRLTELALDKLGIRFTAWIGSLDVDALVERSGLAAAHAFPLRQEKIAAGHLMTPAEEALAAELNLTGGVGWAQLHADLTSQILVRLAPDGGGDERDLPISEVRNLAHHPDRAVRRRAYGAELAAWRGAALPLAAAMNGIKGQAATLATRRGWSDPLDAALFANRIDRETLEAMLGAAEEAFPDFRRYWRVKARALGVPTLAWYDLFAPVRPAGAEPGRVWSFAEAERFVVDRFGVYSDRLSGFAARAFRERWIDAEPRPGKGDGAFCAHLRGGESRILANYAPSYGGVSTLAHELGHAYHNLNEAELTPLQRQTPMTLAETASIFCETIVRHAALAESGPADQVEILDGALQDASQVVVDISSRFRFESAVFAQRRTRALSVDELNALMTDAQRATYGDALDPEALHPFMWAVKPHYYSGASFYNFPYLFGLLFGLGLYAQYGADPAGFHAGYDDLLASTGRADAATLAARFGIDLRRPEFWRASLAVVRADIARFEGLLAPAPDETATAAD